jgi:hypothetical protein
MKRGYVGEQKPDGEFIMAHPFYIWNPAFKFVIDIEEKDGPPKATAPLDAWSMKSPSVGNSNQLWQFKPGPTLNGVGYNFLVNPATSLVIEIDGTDATSYGILKPGASLLRVNTEFGEAGNPTYGTSADPDEGLTGNANQLWVFVPDGSGNYYIQNGMQQHFVIDIQEKFGAPKRGVGLDAYPKKDKAQGNANQVWQFVDDNLNPITGVPPDTLTVISNVPPQTGTSVKK